MRVSLKLRESAKDCPACTSCGLPNPNGDMLCLAHSNELRHGRGAYHKSEDIFGAIVCDRCHFDIDKNHKLSKEQKHEKHRIARERTLKWWWDNGYVVVGKVA